MSLLQGSDPGVPFVGMEARGRFPRLPSHSSAMAAIARYEHLFALSPNTAAEIVNIARARADSY